MRRFLAAAVVLAALFAVGLYVLRGKPAEVVTPPPETSAPTHPAPRLRAENDEGATLTGHVVDGSGAPVRGARVQLLSSGREKPGLSECSEGHPLLACPSPMSARELARWLEGHPASEQLETRTDDQGRFSFEHLASAAVDVFASAEGLEPAVRERSVPGEELELRLAPPQTLQAKVIDEQGSAVSARLLVLGPALPQPLEVQVPGGGAAFSGAGVGPLTVLAQAPGFLPAKLGVTGGSVSLTLVRPRALHVRVRGPSGPLDAQVEVEASHVHAKAATRDGRADFDSLYPSEVMVRASAPGLASSSKFVDPKALDTEVELSLVPGAPVWVSLADGQGQPVVDPTVLLERLDGMGDGVRRKGRTGERISLGTVPSGTYRLRAHAKGYRLVEQAVTVGTSEVDVELTLERGPHISGKVVDAQGRAVQGVSVALAPIGDGATSESDGRFELSVPSLGHYTLTAHHSEWGGATVEADAPAENVLLKLEPHAGLDAVVESGGQPVAGAVVSVSLEGDAENHYFTDQVTDDRGHVLLRGVPAGKYLATAEQPHFRPATPLPVTLVEGQTQSLRLELAPGATLGGTVHDEQGAPVAGVRIDARQEDERQGTQSQADGHFELGPLDPAKSYTLIVTKSGYALLRREGVRAGDSPLELALQSRHSLSGRVLDDRGRPLESVRVNGWPTQTDDGRFTHEPFSGEPEDLLIVGASGFREKEVKVPPGATDVGDLTLEPAPSLGGRVVDASGAPVASAFVDCDLCADRAVTDAQGQYALSLPDGARPSRVNASANGQTGSVRVPPEGPVPEVVLAGKVHVTGRVTGADGQPLPGAMVVALSISPGSQAMVVTGADGVFATDLSPGTYRFEIGADFTGGGSAVVAHVAGTQARVDLGPAPGAGPLVVHVPAAPGELWLVRGDVPAPSDVDALEPAYAVVVPFRLTTVQVTGIAPGHYTAFTAQRFGGPLFAGPLAVDIPGPGEVTLPAFAQRSESE